MFELLIVMLVALVVLLCWAIYAWRRNIRKNIRDFISERLIPLAEPEKAKGVFRIGIFVWATLFLGVAIFYVIQAREESSREKDREITIAKWQRIQIENDNNPYSEENLTKKDREFSLRPSLGQAVYANPDTEAKLQALAKKYNLPIDKIRLEQPKNNVGQVDPYGEIIEKKQKLCQELVSKELRKIIISQDSDPIEATRQINAKRFEMEQECFGVWRLKIN